MPVTTTSSDGLTHVRDEVRRYIQDNWWRLFSDIPFDEEDYREADTLGWPVIETERQVCATIRFSEHPHVLAECWWMPDDEDLDVDWDEPASTSWITRFLMHQGRHIAALFSEGSPFKNTVAQAYARGMPR